MKVIGLIGGISSESTTAYYQIINRQTNAKLGGHHTAKIVMVSLDFNDVVTAIYNNRWNDVSRIMVNAAHQLEQAKVDFIAICSNTLYKVAPDIEKAIHVPLLHILDPTVEEIKRQKIKKVGLLGTRFTMNDTFHREYLSNRFHIESIIPDDHEKEIINSIIFDELCFNIAKNESKEKVLNIINTLQKKGVEGIIFGCTELPLLLPLMPHHLNLPIFDTTTIHAKAIVNYALQK